MFNRNVGTAIRGLAVAALLAVPVAGSPASAQEAIMLERIGAVRMEQAGEIEQVTAAQEVSPAQREGESPHADGR